MAIGILPAVACPSTATAPSDTVAERLGFAQTSFVPCWRVRCHAFLRFSTFIVFRRCDCRGGGGCSRAECPVNRIRATAGSSGRVRATYIQWARREVEASPPLIPGRSSSSLQVAGCCRPTLGSRSAFFRVSHGRGWRYGRGSTSLAAVNYGRRGRPRLDALKGGGRATTCRPPSSYGGMWRRQHAPE